MGESYICIHSDRVDPSEQRWTERFTELYMALKHLLELRKKGERKNPIKKYLWSRTSQTFQPSPLSVPTIINR